MEKSKVAIKKSTSHDFLDYRRWVFVVLGMADIKGTLYYMIITAIYSLHTFVGLMTFAAVYLVYPNKEKMIECLHVFILVLFSTWTLTARLYHAGSLIGARRIINQGVYVYAGEPVDEVEVKMKEDAVDEIQRKCDALAMMLLTTAISSLVMLPLTQYLFLGKDPDEKMNSILNPYLPNPIYMPFGTFTFRGYALGFIVNTFFILLTFGNANCMNQIYLSVALQLKVELEVLNHSLMNIEKRALLMYGKPSKGVDIYTDPKFQSCMYLCLKANVLHHQALIRFHKSFQPFVGTCLMISAVLASASYASSLFIILQNPPLNRMTVAALNLFVEQCYNYFLCFVGQRVLDQSTLLRQSLFSTPWYSCNKRFNKLLGIMMCSTLKPIKLETILFNITASVQTHGDVLSLMYKIINLLRQ